jgi:probable DNA metabolism protein
MYRVTLSAPDDFNEFRTHARGLIAVNAPPESISWSVGDAPGLFGDLPPPSSAQFTVPAAFVPFAEAVICHSDGERFALLYDLLWRLTHGERRLLEDAADPLVHRLERMQKSVGRDMHKMTAFVRFRQVADDGGEHYVAWFEPEHLILRRVAPFFVGRFAAMRWSILTPLGSLHWNGKDLVVGPAVSRSDAPREDALEGWWRTYYKSTFNPARANPDAQRAEMPKKYWRNLPEAPLIPGMLDEAAKRTRRMIEMPPPAPRAARNVYAPAVVSVPTGGLGEVAAQAAACERCPLFAHATQTVFGHGPADAPVVFVGEQPGDQEDLAGLPFVGPAGQMFDRALAQAGIDRGHVYVTNAVKHFKFEPRGKRRIHKKPNHQEIDACRGWLDQELALAKPRLTVGLGATAARALTGRDVTISRERGRLLQFNGGHSGLITVHPSFLLRLPGRAAQEHEYARFVADLRLVLEHIPDIRKAA